MEMAAVTEIAGERELARRDFPFGLGRQALARPAGEGVGLVEADMAERFGRVDRALARQGEDAPLAVIAMPVERRLPALLLHRRPALRQPEFRPTIAALGDEFEIVSATDRLGGEAERLEPDLVARPLIVECETRAGMADLIEPAVEFDP